MNPEKEPAGLNESDAHVIRLVQSGHVEAFEKLVARHQGRVFNTALRMLGDYDDANEVTQEVFLNCFRKIATFRGDSQFTTWLYRITVNAVKNLWKHRERRAARKTVSLHDVPEGGDGYSVEDRLATTRPSPRHLAQVSEKHQILLAKLQELHADYREVLVLRCVEELSYEEITKVLGCSLGTVKSRLHRARELIRKKMADYL